MALHQHGALPPEVMAAQGINTGIVPPGPPPQAGPQAAPPSLPAGPSPVPLQGPPAQAAGPPAQPPVASLGPEQLALVQTVMEDTEVVLALAEIFNQLEAMGQEQNQAQAQAQPSVGQQMFGGPV